MNHNERADRLLRPLNTLDGRDVIKLLWRKCDECEYELCVDNNNNVMKVCNNERDLRLLRPLNTLDGRDVMEL